MQELKAGFALLLKPANLMALVVRGRMRRLNYDYVDAQEDCFCLQSRCGCDFRQVLFTLHCLAKIAVMFVCWSVLSS